MIPGKLEAPPRMEGKQLYAYFLPDKHKVQVLKDSLAKEKKSPAAEVKTEKPKTITEENKTKENLDA